MMAKEVKVQQIATLLGPLSSAAQLANSGVPGRYGISGKGISGGGMSAPEGMSVPDIVKSRRVTWAVLLGVVGDG
jgi:hypothetical protein